MSVLYNFYEKSILENCTVSDTDEMILSLVEEYEEEYYDGLMPDDCNWEVFVNLSRMRNSLLNWYSFKQDASILEINSGYGALTGLLCDRGREVTALEGSMLRARILNKRYSKRTNLQICVGNLENISEDRKFDYIVAAGALENIQINILEYLKQLKSKLKEGGKLLIAVENRYGLKYFCGETNELVKVPFEGINKYPQGGDMNLLSRQELINIIQNVGFCNYKLYYPMPDYKLTQAVYTDEYMPQESIRDRIIPYYLHPENLVAVEDRIYDDLIQNKVLHFFANSFLIECSVDSEAENVIYAALSTDREKSHAFATIIQSDNFVIKKALYPEGIKVLRNIYENLCNIQKAGISVVPVKMKDDHLEMPFIKQKNLADMLTEIIHKDKSEFEEIIDKLYSVILKSSEHVSTAQCALNMKKIPVEEVGIILKEAYIDMIPYNCFYSNGTFSFYDQEFKRRNFPAKYILFRVLRYMYFYIPDAETIIPLQYFKEKYLLVRLWGIYEKEEARFIEENRNCDSLVQFYKWAHLDRERILSKGEMSLNEVVKPEYDYEVDEELKAVKKAQLEILKYFSGFCQKNDLRYCAIYGSLLGTVRHRGFIPWDDDIDVAMPREDYEKLKELANNSIKMPYFFQFPENDAECFYGGYGKLRNSMTCGLEGINAGHKCNQGIWIDIFPLDNCYENEEKRYKHIRKINFCQQLLWYKVYPERKEKFKDMSGGKLFVIKILSRIFSHKKLCRYLENIITECDEETDKLAILSRYLKPDEVKVFDKHDFEHSFMMEFEDTLMPVPIGYGNWLRKNVGADYMIYPRPKERVPHHRARYAVDKSYLEMI